jgi:NAD(P)-dependent dehydrogenase (short-subunit alcohol dehydrogenase family)
MTLGDVFAGQVAIVTGGGRGLGEAIAERLTRDAMHVIVADADETAAQRVGDNLRAAGRRAESETVDVTQEGEVAALVESVVERHGGLHHLVCSAAIEQRAALTDTTDDDWQRILDVNLKGPFLCMKHAIPRIANAGGGSVTLLGSVLGFIGQPAYSAYSASKGALANLMKQAAIEHATDAVRVNLVSPAATDTGLFMQMARRSGDPDAIIDMVTRHNPMRRLGKASEVADTVAFLCSPGAAYLSGVVVPLDGAMAARRIV